MTHADRQRQGVDWIARHFFATLLYHEAGRVAVFSEPLTQSPWIELQFMDDFPIYFGEPSSSLYASSRSERTILTVQTFSTKEHRTYVYKAQVE